MEAYLERLEREYALLLSRPWRPHGHNCTFELDAISCVHCETMWDMREDLEYEILITKEELAPYYAAQTKQRMPYLCRDMVRPLATSLQDRIVAMVLLVNGQG